jgi:hypothetical protein
VACARDGAKSVAPISMVTAAAVEKAMTVARIVLLSRRMSRHRTYMTIAVGNTIDPGQGSSEGASAPRFGQPTPRQHPWSAAQRSPMRTLVPSMKPACARPSRMSIFSAMARDGVKGVVVASDAMFFSERRRIF